MPSDPSFFEQWALNNTGQTNGTEDSDIDAPEAWDITTGNPDIVIAVVDTGVDWDHPDLAANIWTNEDEIAGDSLDNDGNGYTDDIRGWDFVTVKDIDLKSAPDEELVDHAKANNLVVVTADWRVKDLCSLAEVRCVRITNSCIYKIIKEKLQKMENVNDG